jgi:hypothetical protein
MLQRSRLLNNEDSFSKYALNAEGEIQFPQTAAENVMVASLD